MTSPPAYTDGDADGAPSYGPTPLGRLSRGVSGDLFRQPIDKAN